MTGDLACLGMARMEAGGQEEPVRGVGQDARAGEALVKPLEEPLERCKLGRGGVPGAAGWGHLWEEDVVTVSGAPEGRGS